jgi:hypothetical protein
MIAKAKLIGVLVLVVSLYGAGFHHAHSNGEAKLRGLQRDSAMMTVRLTAQAREIEQSHAERRSLLAELAVERARETRALDEAIVNEVIRYVPQPVPAECPIGPDPEWVRIHNRATARPGLSGADPGGTAGASHGSARAPDYAMTLRVVTQNYGKYRALADQLEELQQWILAERQ